jgi:hypothetical protein
MSKQTYVITAYNSRRELLATRTAYGKADAKAEYARAIQNSARLGGFANCEPDPYDLPTKRAADELPENDFYVGDSPDH